MYLCPTYRHEVYAHTYTIAYKHIYVVLSLGSLKINFLLSLFFSLMTLHGYFKLVAAEMRGEKHQIALLNLNFSLLFTSQSIIIPSDL